MTDTSSRAAHQAKLKRILAGLASHERDALYRFYALGEDPEKISRELSLEKDEFRELRARVRKSLQAPGRTQ